MTTRSVGHPYGVIDARWLADQGFDSPLEDPISGRPLLVGVDVPTQDQLAEAETAQRLKATSPIPDTWQGCRSAPADLCGADAGPQRARAGG